VTARAVPRLRVEQACQRLGPSQVVARCLRVLAGHTDDPDLVVMLGDSHAAQLLSNGIPANQAYWLRVWAARGLLWAGPGDDTKVLRAALSDDAWRVREMTCKVVARHRVGDLLDDVAALESDPVPRVRMAATRAVTRIVAGEA
jgi:hypothetical protein